MKIVVLPGDGIGPETMAATVAVLQAMVMPFTPCSASQLPTVSVRWVM